MACACTEKSNLLLIDQAGKIIRLPSNEIRTMGRQAKGVRLIRLDENQKLATIVAFEEDESNGTGSTPGSSEGGNNAGPRKTSGAHLESIDPAEQELLLAQEIDVQEEEETEQENSVAPEAVIFAKGTDDEDPFAGF